MARKNRSEVIVPSEIAIVHTICKVIRRCMLMGYDPATKKNSDHRKVWIENELKRLAVHFGVDVLAFSILSNHVHQVLRSRPDIVETWNDREVAKRWLRLCPTVAQVNKSARKQKKEVKAVMAEHQATPRENAVDAANCENPVEGSATPPAPLTGPAFPFSFEPLEAAINKIVNNAKNLKAIRLRLSDISWWMRLMCQCVAASAVSLTELHSLALEILSNRRSHHAFVASTRECRETAASFKLRSWWVHWFAHLSTHLSNLLSRSD